MDDFSNESTREREWRCDKSSDDDDDVDSCLTIDTYRSTDSSHLSIYNSALSDYGVAARHVLDWAEPTPTTPLTFATLFPSCRKLTIRHDDASDDGNLNLRVNTLAGSPGGCQRIMTLFHLRMRNLRSREFSLRRYHRDSGREICHSSAKAPLPAARKLPVLQASLSSAIAILRSRKTSINSESQRPKRRDSGYASIESDRSVDMAPNLSPQHVSSASESLDRIILEFSNYAHVEVKHKRLKRDNRYEFEYWGVHYSWKRVMKSAPTGVELRYNLFRRGDRRIVAQIVPIDLTQTEVHEEMARGGWVPPSYMWINDRELPEVVTGTSDIVIATGLISLVDDSIRQRFQAQEENKAASSLTAILPFQTRHVGARRKTDATD